MINAEYLISISYNTSESTLMVSNNFSSVWG